MHETRNAVTGQVTILSKICEIWRKKSF